LINRSVVIKFPYTNYVAATCVKIQQSGLLDGVCNLVQLPGVLISYRVISGCPRVGA